MGVGLAALVGFVVPSLGRPATVPVVVVVGVAFHLKCNPTRRMLGPVLAVALGGDSGN